MDDRCKHGHEMTEENTYRWGGKRQCRVCRNNRNKDEQRKVRAEARLYRTATGRESKSIEGIHT